MWEFHSHLYIAFGFLLLALAVVSAVGGRSLREHEIGEELARQESKERSQLLWIPMAVVRGLNSPRHRPAPA